MIRHQGTTRSRAPGTAEATTAVGGRCRGAATCAADGDLLGGQLATDGYRVAVVIFEFGDRVAGCLDVREQLTVRRKN